jgi:hypothetical protein
MFVGHYAAAIAAKAIAPKAPMWTLAAGCQLVDIGWSAFIMAGIERASVDPSLPGSPLVLEHMPWTHSLPMTFVWAIGAALAARVLLRLPMLASVIVGLTVASHWVFDWLVHRPDLELWIGGDKVGLALWNYPVPEQALEIGLLAVAALFWGAARRGQGQPSWPAAAFIALLIVLQVAAMLTPMQADPIPMGGSALAVYLAVAALAALTDKHGKRAVAA